jgi:hypothetical protein
MADHLPGCSCCGAPLDPVDLDIRSALPDPILRLSPEQRPSVWGNRNFQQADNVGAFVRCLMPVTLTGASTVTYSVWLSVHPDQLRQAYAHWDTPAYADLQLDGVIANAIKPWPDLFGEAARAEVRDVDSLPYLVATQHGLLSRVLSEVWDRDDVLSRIWHALPVTVRQQITDDWSVERTAGLAPRIANGVMIFAGPGRTVHVKAFNVPAATSVDSAVATMLDAAPQQPEGELVEHDGDLLRRALWLTTTVDGHTQHDFYGVAAMPGSVLTTTCMYDDPQDLRWASTVWRSARHHPSEVAGPQPTGR